MPSTPRPKGKATKIAYAILGKPETLQNKTPRDSKIEKRLVFEETTRAR